MSTITLDDMLTPVWTRAHRPHPAAPISTMRLTRRGRVVIVLVGLLLAFAVGVFVTAAGSVATQRPGTPEPTRIVQVDAGQSLWSIAASLDHDGDVRAMMRRIELLNALDTSVLQAGQRLVVPAG